MFRKLVEKAFRKRSFKRRLPVRFGGRVIMVSPDARLRFLKLGDQAFDASLLSYVDRYVLPGASVWDVGANVGEFSLAAAHMVGKTGNVLAIEPDPFLFQLLEQSCADPTNRDLNVATLQAAVNDRSGVVEFCVSERSRAANSLVRVVPSTQQGGVRQTLEVLSKTLDELLTKYARPQIVKVDIEGAELLALKGAKTLLAQVRPVWIIEVSKGTQAEVAKTFKEANYLLFDADEGLDKLPIDQCVFNTLAIPKENIDIFKNALGRSEKPLEGFSGHKISMDSLRKFTS